MIWFLLGFIQLFQKRPELVRGRVRSLIIFFTNVTLPGTTSSDSVSGVLLTDLTDHFPVFFNTQCKPDVNVHDDILIRNYSECNIAKFISDISSTNYCESDVNFAYDVFLDLFKNVYDKSFPTILLKRKGRHSDKQSWITSGTITSIKRRNKLYKTMLNNPSQQNKPEYKTFSNKLIHIIRISKKNNFTSMFV